MHFFIYYYLLMVGFETEASKNRICKHRVLLLGIKENINSLGLQSRKNTNTNPYNPHYLYIFSLFVNSSNKNRASCQADVTATPLASFALKMAAEAVETSAATNFSPEISTCLYSFPVFHNMHRKCNVFFLRQKAVWS